MNQYHKQRSETVIVDYGLGNLFSIKQACHAVGIPTKFSGNKAEILAAPAIILPGVGAFGEAMQTLNQLNLTLVLREFAHSGKPFMGICLGMQLLFTESSEFGSHKGLDLVKGTVKRFPEVTGSTGERIKIPQVGWNSLQPPLNRTWQDSPLEHLKTGCQVYFVHSYYTVPEDPEIVLAQTSYAGISYCSALAKDNIFAVQFHPEKSGPEGLKIYANWAKNI